MSFSSQAIQAIRSSSEAFVGHCDPSGKDWIKIRKYHAAWLAELPKRDRSAVEAIIRLLFPRVAWALNGPLRGEEYIETWDRQKRICSTKHFEAYFRLGLSAGEAAEYQWQNMVELLDDATALARALQRFGPLEEGQGAVWVDELLRQSSEFVNDKATPAQARSLFRAIMCRGDQIAAVKDDDSDSSLKIDPIHGAVSVLLDCLLRIGNSEERFAVLLKSVSEDAGLLTSAELLDLLHYRSDIFADGGEMPDARANTTKLRQVLKTLDRRILKASRDGELAEHPRFMKIVQKWRQFGRRTKPREWVRAECQSDERFVEALMQLRSGAGLEEDGSLVDPANILPVQLLSDLFDRNEMSSRCQRILGEQPDWLTSDRAATVRLLQGLLRR